jgi:hypothetical protein
MKRRAQPQAQRAARNALYTKETLTVLLRPDHRGLGIGLKQTEERLDYVVDILEPGGPAERSGVLLPGDRVIAVNRRSLRDVQPAEVAMILEAPQVPPFHCPSARLRSFSLYTRIPGVLSIIAPGKGLLKKPSLR